MNFKERCRVAFDKIKVRLIVTIIILIIITVTGIAPFSVSLVSSLKNNGDEVITMDWESFFESLFYNLPHPLMALKACFATAENRHAFFVILRIFLGMFSVFFLWGFARAFPKHEYTDIENGSSGWSEHGEQYQVLSRNKGIVLAEKNYLPVDKRGNVNVLVVRRFWCW